MTTVLGVKKAGNVAIAADPLTLVTFADPRLSAWFEARSKLRKALPAASSSAWPALRRSLVWPVAVNSTKTWGVPPKFSPSN